MSHDASNSSVGPVVLVATAVTAVITAVAVSLTGSSGGGVRLAEVPRAYAAPNAAQRALVKMAYRLGPGSGIRYVWGGTSTRGFDCSGFSQYVYRHAIGVSIPRTTGTQWFSSTGKRVPYQQERAGDLVYFVGAYGSRSVPGHMGVYAGNGKYIEYYRSGLPARVNYLSSSSRGYLGAKRWYTPARVPEKLLAYLDRLALKYHVRIVGSFTMKDWKRWAIDFVPHSRPMWRWARTHDLKVRQLPHRTRLFLRPNPR